MDELDSVVARQLDAALDDGQMRREDLAREMATLGFRWTGNTVSQVISGRRSLSLLELAGICELLSQPVGDLLGRAGGEVELPAGGEVDVGDVAQALQHGGSSWTAKRATLGRLRGAYGEHLEATIKAAKRLGVTPAEVDAASVKLWGQVLASERDKRVAATGHESPRTLQARRGHVTRALLAELREHLDRRSGETR